MNSSLGYSLPDLHADEALRRREFPVAAGRIFLAHAGVAPLCRAARDALVEAAVCAASEAQENEEVWRRIHDARREAAALLGADATEIALLGPTSLGLNLVANGLPWSPGDEVVCYMDDYPANVYPWLRLRGRGVVVRCLAPEAPGRITWDLVAAALTSRTRLVALASCHFLSGYRIDIDGIGRRLRERGVLFCLDAIQSLGAFPTRVTHVDFLSADAHKWLLGPNGAGIFFVARQHWDLLEPSLVGSWNIVSPHYVAQTELVPVGGARRYEPGTLNTSGILAMHASLQLLNRLGVEAIAERLLSWRHEFLSRVRPLGFQVYGCDDAMDLPEDARSAIITIVHADATPSALAKALHQEGIDVSVRADRAGQGVLRLSPHFYTTFEELERTVDVLAALTH